MPYELAKELKDAGFPQTEDQYCRCSFLTAEQLDGVPVIYDCKTERVSKPTLEELIEACGDEFVCLREFRAEMRRQGPTSAKHAPAEKYWIAESSRVLSGRDGTHSWVARNGSTPTEAVARLWLALNKQ
jgi:hypothetical protein